MLIKKENAVGYFGNADDNVRIQNNYDENKFIALKSKLEEKSGVAIKNIFFLKQTHSADVFVINEEDTLKKSINLFSYDGDAIITNQKNIGIGVVTADCVPLFLIDTENNAIAVIHAGWKGLHVRIISETIKKMRTVFHTNPSKLNAYIGPSACLCCYEVQNDFFNYFPKKYFENRDMKFFFSSKQAAIDELIENKILESNIDASNNHCTICSTHYCSVRRQGDSAGRQPSIIFLR